MAIKNARDVYTRRNEGVSIWAVKSADIVASAPGDQEALFDPASEQDLPASDVLPDARRSEAPLSAVRPHRIPGDDARRTAVPVPAAPRRFAADPRAAARRMGRPRAGARGGHRADQRRARPPRPGAAVALVRGRGRGALQASGPRRGRARVPARERAVPQSPARRAAERQLRRHDRAAIPVRCVAPAAAARARASRATRPSPGSPPRPPRRRRITSSARATG